MSIKADSCSLPSSYPDAIDLLTFSNLSRLPEIHTEDLEGYTLDGDNASLEETLDSRQRRGKTGPRFLFTAQFIPGRH
jgi:hypothetical protein